MTYCNVRNLCMDITCDFLAKHRNMCFMSCMIIINYHLLSFCLCCWFDWGNRMIFIIYVMIQWSCIIQKTYLFCMSSIPMHCSRFCVSRCNRWCIFDSVISIFPWFCSFCFENLCSFVLEFYIFNLLLYDICNNCLTIFNFSTSISCL